MAEIPLHFEETQAKVPDGPYGPMIFEAAKRHALNPQVVAALIRAESAGNPRAVSNKGARGLMQLMPATAERFGLRREKLLDPKENLEAGVTYLSWLIEQFPNDLSKVLAAYNAGENAVWRYKRHPPLPRDPRVRPPHLRHAGIDGQGRGAVSPQPRAPHRITISVRSSARGWPAGVGARPPPAGGCGCSRALSPGAPASTRFTLS